MNSCISYILLEVGLVKPKVIFLLGNIVYNSIKNNSIEIDSKLIIKHPSYIYIYNRKNKDKYISDIIRK